MNSQNVPNQRRERVGRGFGDASEKQEIELNNAEWVENSLNVRTEQEQSSPPSSPQVLSTALSFLSGVPSSPLRIIHQEGFLAAPCPDGALLLPLFVFCSCGLSADHFLFLGRDKMSGIAMCGRARKREQGGREGEKLNNHNKAEGG